MEEIFKPIRGYEEFYQVSNLGRVKSLAKVWSVGKKPDTILKPGQRKTGYQFVVLCVNKVKWYASLHRLVAVAFCDNPNNLPVVNHKDSDTRNNAASNLEWTTSSGNSVHAFKAGRRTGMNGERNGNAKLTQDVVLEIRLMCKMGYYQKEIAEKFGIKQQQVSKIVTGRRWSHLSQT